LIPAWQAMGKVSVAAWSLGGNLCIVPFAIEVK